jgi:MFS family permease
LQAGLFVVSLAVYARTGAHVRAAARVSEEVYGVMRGIREALVALRADPPLFSLFTLSLLVVPIGMAYLKLLPVFARDVVSGGPTALGAMVGIISLGTAASGFALAALGHRLRKGPAVLISSVLYSLLLVLLSTTRDVATAMVVLAAIGVLSGIFLTLTNVLLQSRVADEYRGRVMAIYGMVWGVVPMVTFLAGLVSELVGVVPAIAGLGLICAACCLIVAARNPALMRL